MEEERGFTVTATAAFIADARWDDIGLTRPEALDYIQLFISSLADNSGDEALNIIPDETYPILRLLVIGKLRSRVNLLEIQKDPAFSNWGRQNMIEMAEAYLNGGEQELARMTQVLFDQDRIMNKPLQSIIIFDENTGESQETAIVIRNAVNNEEGVASEYWYLHYKFGRNYGSNIRDWELGYQVLTSDEKTGKKYDVLTIEFPGGNRRSIYFDITDFYNL